MLGMGLQNQRICLSSLSTPPRPPPCSTVCGILVPRLGIEPGLLAVKPRSPNHWTAWEFPVFLSSVEFFKEELNTLVPFSHSIEILFGHSDREKTIKCNC